MWFSRDRQSPRFPYRGAGTLLALVTAGGLYTAWGVLAPSHRQAHPPDRPPETQEHPAPAPTPPEKPPEAPAPEPPEETASSEACPEGCTSSKPGCAIKGNISPKTRERIYHVPGQRYYDKTVISPEDGERWFCTEEEAVANGWRPAKV